MQIEFDRYEPYGGACHLDLATGRLVRIVTRDVPDADWRRRWRARVDVLLAGADGLEVLIDAGEAGREQVFEVRAPAAASGPRRLRAAPARAAIAWLAARGLSPGPCRCDRLTPAGELCADAHAAWPIETARERRAARAATEAWTRVLGHAPARPSVDRDARADGAGGVDGPTDRRAGLIELALPERAALIFARRAGRVAVDAAIDPRALPEPARARAFVIVRAAREQCAAWGALLAAESGRRHFYVPGRSKGERAREPVLAHERAPAYGAGARVDRSRANALLVGAAEAIRRGRLAPALRLAARAEQLAAGGALASEARVLRARAMRLQGRAAEVRALLAAAAAGDPGRATAALLIEAAEAATDCAQLEQGEAFARAALQAALTADGQARARSALDRARVWRGEPVETPFWQARAAWHVWGSPPSWPARGAYLHAPCGPLARWEWTCDALERARWLGIGREIRRRRRRVRAICGRLPPLLRARAEWLADDVPLAARRFGAAAILQTGKAGAAMEVFEHMSALLTLCHDADDHDALGGSAARLRDALRARAVAIFVAGRALPVAGEGERWNGASEVAARCAAAAGAAGPERTGAGLQMAVSIKRGREPIGAIAATWAAHERPDERRARLLLEAGALVLSPVVRAWRDRLEPPRQADMPEIVGSSAAMNAVRDAVRRVARVPFPVLIEGESGAGKELVARAIHRLSPRALKPFRAINCAAMADDLVEAELFGHAQGAFTGAVAARAGLFEDADQGTLFLDEVSELAPRAQAKLLRVLQEGEVRRVGETAARRVDVRIVAASNRPMRAAVDAGAFRADLSFRLDVLRIDVPPLRERPEDIALLCAHFWRDAAARAGTSATLSAEAVGRLAAHSWPGNVRELQNVIAALAVSAPRRGRVTAAHLPTAVAVRSAPPITLHQARASLERDLVQRALARAGGRPARAAAELGVTRQGFAKLMRRLGLPAA